MRTKAKSSKLQTRDVTVKVGEKTILDQINIEAGSGDLLAVLGPTGSGKTTLLNVISGRLKATSGDVTLNGQTFGKKLRRRLAFVQQQDVFFSQLTLWETLYFTARLRLPGCLSETDKRSKIDEIVDMLDMRKCRDTVMGDIFVRGLSGGEKKRASIACELLTDPDILLMDEPTSGLDSSTALTIMQQMKVFASLYNKTIVLTIHQPSSQIYHMFDNLLLLIEGQEGYYGAGKDALDFFERLGLVCEAHFNPADFILQIAKSEEDTVAKVILAAKQRRRPSASQVNRDIKDAVDVNAISYDIANSVVNVDETKVNIGNAASGEIESAADSADRTIDNIESAADSADTTIDNIESAADSADTTIDKTVLLERESADVTSALIGEKGDTTTEESRPGRWVTSWWTQYYMLSWRSLKQTKGVLLQGYSIVQTMVVSLVVGLLYWQIEQNEKTIRDVMGLLFFAVSYWTFNPAFEAISTYLIPDGIHRHEREREEAMWNLNALPKGTIVMATVIENPAEKGVIAKERSAGSYRLSAYYASKITSDLPLAVILPTVMYIIFFTMSGIGGVAEFFYTYPIILLQVLLSQGFGFAIGVAFNGEIKPAFTTFVSYSLCAFMIGGFFTQNVPSWMAWAKYMSTMLYAYGAISIMIMSQYPPIPCNKTSVQVFPQCDSNTTDVVYYTDILDNAGITLPIQLYIYPIFIIIIAFRIIGYIVLKYRRPKLL